MVGTCKKNGSGSNAKKDVERETVHRQKKRKTSFEVLTDLKVVKVKQWMEKTKDREQWRLVVEEPKAHPGL